MTITLGEDISHFQGQPNFVLVKASGRGYVVLKATEGTTYDDPQFATNRRNAHAAGLVVGLYHFARAGNPAAEAAWFLKTIGGLQANEFLVLDWEVPYSNPPAWCDAFLRAVFAAVRVHPLIYMNGSTASGFNWAPVIADDDALWLAKYDNSTSQVAVGAWGSEAMKQYSDKGAVPGISGPVDVDAFYGTLQQLIAYGTPVAPPKEIDLLADERAALMDVHGWLQGVKNSGNPDGLDNTTLIWAQTRDTLAAVTALKAQIQDGFAGVAADVVAALPTGSQVTVADLETALRAVFGTLANAPTLPTS